MTKNIIKPSNQIEAEIAKKRKELAELENELAEAELAYATLAHELDYFERHYNARIGKLLAELDELTAQIAEAIAVLSPHDDNIQGEAEDAREQAKKTYNETHAFSENRGDEKKTEKFIPTEGVKKLFREITKKIHPDLAKDEDDRENRNHYMKQANEAYRDGNIERLMEILKEWEKNPKIKPEDYFESELERLKFLIAQIKQRIVEIENNIKLLKESEIGQLKAKSDLAEENGEDMLSQIALEIQAQINKKHKRILRALRTLTQPD